MFILHVKINMKRDAAAGAERVFAGPFRDAITRQPGFHDVQFLRPVEDGEYVLSIAFEDKKLQQRWVATDLHARVWGKMEQYFDGYTLVSFTPV